MPTKRTLLVPLLFLTLLGLACAGLQPGAPPTATPTVEPSTGSLFNLSELSIDPSIDASKLTIAEGKRRTEDGFIFIPLSVQNNTGAPVRSLFILVEGLDSSGTVIHVDAFIIDSYRLQPGETGYGEYVRDVTKIVGEPADWRLSIGAAHTAQPQYHAVAENVIVTDLGGGFADVTGTIRNDGSDTCASSQAVLAIYENGSQLFKVETYLPDGSGSLPAGDSANFHDSAVPIPAGQVRIDVSASCDFVDGE